METVFKVHGHPELLKSNGSVINTDSKALAAREAQLKANEEMEALKSKVDSLEDKLDRILAALGERSGN